VVDQVVVEVVVDVDVDVDVDVADVADVVVQIGEVVVDQV
jgi:hypothetical protein